MKSKISDLPSILLEAWHSCLDLIWEELIWYLHNICKEKENIIWFGNRLRTTRDLFFICVVSHLYIWILYLPMYMLTLFEMLLPMYMNWSINFRDGTILIKTHKLYFIWVQVATNAPSCVHLAIQQKFNLSRCICKTHRIFNCLWESNNRDIHLHNNFKQVNITSLLCRHSDPCVTGRIKKKWTVHTWWFSVFTRVWLFFWVNFA